MSPYTVERLMLREFRTFQDRGTLTHMGEFHDKAEANAYAEKCRAAETDPRYFYQVVRYNKSMTIKALKI